MNCQNEKSHGSILGYISYGYFGGWNFTTPAPTTLAKVGYGIKPNITPDVSDGNTFINGLNQLYNAVTSDNGDDDGGHGDFGGSDDSSYEDSCGFDESDW